MKSTALLLLLVSGVTFGGEEIELPKQALLRIGASDDVMRGVYLVAFSPDGKLLATRSRDQVIRLWDTESGTERFSLDGHQDRITSLAFSEDSKTLISASPGVDEVVRMWSTSTGKKVLELAHNGLIVEPAGKSGLLAVVGEKQISYYRPGADTPQRSVALKLSSSTFPLCVSPDEKSLVFVKSQNSGARPYVLLVHEIDTGKQQTLTQLENRPTTAQFSPDGRQLSVACRRETGLHVFYLRETVEHDVKHPHDEPIQSIAYSRDGRFLVTASWDETVKVWEVLTDGLVNTLQGHSEHVCAVSFSADGRLLASGASGPTDNSTLLWDVRRVIFGEQEEAKPPSDDDTSKLWEQLAGEPPDAFQAIGVLRQFSEVSLPFFEKKVAELVPTTNADEIKRLLVELDDDKFEVREAAQRRLVDLRVVADEVLRREFETTTSFEVKTRLKQILETPKREKPLPERERRRVHRMVYALELIGSDDAREQLSRLAAGFPNSEIISVAKASIERIENQDAN